MESDTGRMGLNLHTEAEVVEWLKAAIASKGTARAVAAEIGVSPQYLHYVVTGHSPPSKKILDYLGFTQVRRYTKTPKMKKGT